MSDRRAGPIRLLLVEDNPADADLVRLALQRAPEGLFELEHRDRLGAGLERLAEGGIDLVLLDFALPDSFGLETFERVHQAFPGVPVIVLTSLDDDRTATEAVVRGAQDYLVKRELTGGLLSRAVRYAIERHGVEEALRVSEERYALAVRGANDGLWDWDLQEDRVYLSARWLEILGRSPREIVGSVGDWFQLVHPDDLPRLRAAIDAHCEGNGSHLEVEHRMIAIDGKDVWVLTRGAAVRDGDGRTVRVAGSMTDISDRKRAEQQLQHDAFHDGLTDLPNRALFVDRLAMALAGLRRRPKDSFAVLFLDLDRFKNVNDSLGHRAGDELLIAIARRLERFVRPDDTVARLGGDEFAILVGGAAAATEAVQVAIRLQETLSEPFWIGDGQVYVTASIGIAFGQLEASPDSILRDADIAMYRAKAAGRARYEVFDRDMHANVLRLLRLETELRQAVDRDEFVMHYQPIINLHTGRIVAFEGLVRWNHPERGLVTPTQFIAVAEETGLIVPLGWWVLEESCRQARIWQDEFPADPPLAISVNVSGKLFLQRDVIPRLTAILEQTGLSPDSLRLEVTESVVVDHVERALDNLRTLRDLGIQLSIDDFGTGYSSLSYLQRFQYDTLKIDRSFVSSLSEGREAQAIVETILSLASGLGIDVIAEGVETADQVRTLRHLRCPQGQGFWFARPLDAAAASELIASAPSW